MIDALTDLFILRGVPKYIRSDNEPEFIAETVRRWINAVDAKTAYIEPGSPWENGYCESFNGKMRDELRVYPEFCALAHFLHHWEAVFEHDCELAFHQMPFRHRPFPLG